MENRVRFQIRIPKETDQRIKAAMPLANCQSQNEFVEKALNYYCGYLMAEDSVSILASALVQALQSVVQESERHTARMLFKLAVEVDILMHVLASAVEIDPAILDKLRGVCVREIKKSNGMIRLEDVVLYQQGADRS